MTKYLIKRVLIFIPLAFGVITIVFILLRLMPGSPVYRLAGAHATPDLIESITRRLHLDRPVWEQYLLYLQGLVTGDWGESSQTSNPVTVDLVARIPITLELITYTLINCIVIGVFLGALSALNEKGVIRRIADVYGLIAGAIADFWLGLMLIYVFFFLLGWAPPPMGRISMLMTEPTRITGFILVDSVLTGNWAVFANAFPRYILPVTTLTFCFMGQIVKMMRSSVSDILQSDFISYAKMMGMPKRVIRNYSMKNAMPPVVTMVGFVYGFLLGGAVLVETVFAWGGLGQYVVQGVAYHDYPAIQGFMIVATIFSMLVYLAVDIVCMLIDPRVKY